MLLKKTLLAAVAVASLAGTNAAFAVDRNHDGLPDRSRAERIVEHDRYWRPEFRAGRYVERDRVLVELRRHNYVRFIGDPYFFHGRYVVRTYNRFNREVFVEINPYTGAFMGEIVL
jgi:Ni/Co efflux regulator RcnB